MPIAEIKLRRGTTVDWLLHDPVLSAGEPGYDLTTKRIKVGDGTTPWSGLLFQTIDPATLTVMLAQVDAAVATAEAAADTAADAAASVQREVVNGVAGLDANGLLYPQRIPPGVGVNDTALLGVMTDPATKTYDLLQDLAARGEAAIPNIRAALRPMVYYKTYTVDTTATTNASLRLYKTYLEARTAIETEQRADGGNQSADSERVTPARRRLIRVMPGTYTEDIFPPMYTDIVGVSGTPTDTIFTNTGVGSGGVLQHTGKSSYIANLSFIDTGADIHRHPCRDGGPSGSSDLTKGRQVRTVVHDNCIFRSSDNAADEACALDFTAGPGCTFVSINSTYSSPRQTQAMSLVVNTGSVAAFPYQTDHQSASRCIIINPTIVANRTARIDSIRQDAYPVGLVDGGEMRGDSFWFYGGTFDTASGPSAITRCDVAVSAAAVGKQSSHFTLSDGLWVVGKTDVTNQAQIHNTKTNPAEIPTRCVSREEVDCYFPDSWADQSLVQSLAHPVVSTGKAVLVANRIYYVKVPIPYLYRLSYATIGVGVAAGTCVAGIYLDEGGVPSTDNNMFQTMNVNTLRTGKFDIGTLFNRRIIWPGHKYVWFAFVVSDPTATVDVVANAGTAGVTSMYKDGWAGAALPSPTALTAAANADTVPCVTFWNYSDFRPVVQRVAGSGTYTIPENARAVDVILGSGGGGGGAGRRGVAGVIRCGGGGGGGGAIMRMSYPVDSLASKTMAFNCGAGGAGAVAQATDDTNGANGTAGSISSLTCGGVTLVSCAGGGGGAGGGLGAGGTGGGGQDGSTGPGVVGGAASLTGGAGTAGPNSAFAVPGGGAGGGLPAANGFQNGGNGGFPLQRFQANATGGNTVGLAGGNAADIVGGCEAGTGGGGGASGGSTVAGGNGGNAGRFCAGGGGGGASQNGFASGAGGRGADGFVIILPRY